MKKLVPYLDVITLFASKLSTPNSPNSQDLEIFVFSGFDYMCFGGNAIVVIYSVFHKKVVVFFFANN